jgi:hypothetical protein
MTDPAIIPPQKKLEEELQSLAREHPDDQCRRCGTMLEAGSGVNEMSKP